MREESCVIPIHLSYIIPTGSLIGRLRRKAFAFAAS